MTYLFQNFFGQNILPRLGFGFFHFRGQIYAWKKNGKSCSVIFWDPNQAFFSKPRYPHPQVSPNLPPPIENSFSRIGRSFLIGMPVMHAVTPGRAFSRTRQWTGNRGKHRGLKLPCLFVLRDVLQAKRKKAVLVGTTGTEDPPADENVLRHTVPVVRNGSIFIHLSDLRSLIFWH